MESWKSHFRDENGRNVPSGGYAVAVDTVLGWVIGGYAVAVDPALGWGRKRAPGMEGVVPCA